MQKQNTQTDSPEETKIARLKRTIANYLASTDKNTQFWDAAKIAEWALLQLEDKTRLEGQVKELREALQKIDAKSFHKKEWAEMAEIGEIAKQALNNTKP